MGRAKMDRDAAISAYVNDGMSTGAIAKYFGVSQEAVIKCLKKAGVFERYKNMEQWNKGDNQFGIDAEQVAKEYLMGGVTYQQLADRYGCSPCTIKNWILKSGLVNKDDLPGLGGGMYREDIDDDVLKNEYVVNRLTVSQIARKYGLVGNTVKSRLTKLGVFVARGSVAKW